MKTFLNQMIKFMIIGAVGTLLNLAVLFLLTDFLKIWYMFSAFLGIAVGITINFYGNKYLTFKNFAKSKKEVLFQYLKYWLFNSIAIVLYNGLLYMFVEFFGIWYMLAAALAVLISFIPNFAMNKFFTFRDFRF